MKFNIVFSLLYFTREDLSEDFPQLETDESYSLMVPETGGIAAADARTVYGALRALESFSQLVRFDFEKGVYTIKDVRAITTCRPFSQI